MELHVVTSTLYQRLETTSKDDIVFVDNDILIYIWHSPLYNNENKPITFTYVSKFYSRQDYGTYYKDIFYFEGAHNLTPEEAKVYLTFI
jgi:hypothetical protein